MFTLYGDYLRYRADEVGTVSLIRLLRTLGLSSYAVRSTLSRMVRKGWLSGRKVGRHSFYSLTPKTERLLDEGEQKLFAPQPRLWDGRWRILTYSVPEMRRQLRDRLRERLTIRGYGRLGSSTWITPYEPAQEITDWLASSGASQYVQLFRAELAGCADDRDVAVRAWDLDALATAYRDFLDLHGADYRRHREVVGRGGELEPEEAFVRRFRLTLSYLSFPYSDPGLDARLLPDDWPGGAAATLFREYHDLLTPVAHSFVGDVLAAGPEPG